MSSVKKIAIQSPREMLTSALFIVPAVLIFSVFYLYPFFDLFKLSVHSWNGIALDKTFVGAQNFIELMQDKVWWSSMWHAGFITIVALVFQNSLALFLAILCDRELRAKQFYRVVFFLPPVMSEVVVGLIWTWILAAGVHQGEQIGLLNHVLSQIGLHHLVNDWLSNPKTALACIAVVHSWKGFGWGFIMILAGLQTIDRQLYEASRVDGADAWQRFVHVTMPMMIPVFLVVVILTILGAMQSFVLILSMVGQGLVYHTEVPVTRILASMSGTHEFGYACAQAIVFAVVLIIVSLLFKVFSERMKQV